MPRVPVKIWQAAEPTGTPAKPKILLNMLLGVLDLENVTVDDIMVPRTEIFGIDINDEIDDILSQLALGLAHANLNRTLAREAK